jgi:hypothetical protein
MHTDFPIEQGWVSQQDYTVEETFNLETYRSPQPPVIDALSPIGFTAAAVRQP